MANPSWAQDSWYSSISTHLHADRYRALPPRPGPAGFGSPHPRQPAPMLFRKADAMFSAPDWTYEPKWDGFRVLASIRDGHVSLVSRNGHSFTNLFGPVSDALRGFPVALLLD